jgi:hypothetical protein
MEKKLILLGISLFMLFGILGCSAGKTSSRPAGNAGISENEEQINLDLENCGVINDTVADVFKEASIQSDRISQAIFNQPVEILQEKDNWVKVR